jgi:hypothetical protein
MTVNENGLVLFCCQAVACVGVGCMHVCGVGGGTNKKAQFMMYIVYLTTLFQFLTYIASNEMVLSE